jgi:3',5'-cyclic AMP phosphodiesterase CpdA
MEEQTLFSWVHLSDIHIGHGDTSHGWNQKLVLEALRRDVASKPGPERVDWILVTGDVGFSGAGRSPDEYTRAAEWLRALAAAASIDPRWVWIVPGNHDVNRGVDAERSVGRLVDGLRSDRESLDTVLADAGDRALLAKRMSAYLEFAKGFAPWALEDALPEAPRRLFWTRRIKLPSGLRVRLVGLNTALLSRDDTDQGKLKLGNEQLADALLAPLDEGEVVIGLSHHPLTSGWLSDEKEALGWIRSYAHLHLSGHVHEAESVDLRSGAGGEFVHVVAGAAHGEKMPKDVPAGHGYNYGEIVHTGGGVLELRVWPRRWSEQNKEFRADVDSVPKDNMRKGLPFARHPLRARLPGIAAPAVATATPPATVATQPATVVTQPAAIATPPATTAAQPATTATPAAASGSTEVFYLYAPEDEAMLSRLDTHLTLLKRAGVITSFSRRSIERGADVEAEIAAHVESARIFLVMVSASFLASDFFDGPLMARILARRSEGAIVIPIYLKPCDWRDTPIAALTVLPKEYKNREFEPVPVSQLDQDEAFADIAFELRSLLKPSAKKW